MVYVNQYFEKNLSTSEVTTHYYLGGKQVAYKRGSELRYPLDDHLFSSVGSMDSSGNKVATVKYFPFGGTRLQEGDLGFDKMFTGQRLDDTGLYYYNARYYDATIGRFISPDTIVPNPANPQSLNRYSYCLNNPLKYFDPSGHQYEYITKASVMSYAQQNWNNPGASLTSLGRSVGFTLAVISAVSSPAGAARLGAQIASASPSAAAPTSGGGLGDFFCGIGDAFVDTFNGAKSVVTDPVGTAKGVWHAATNPVETAEAIYDDYSTRYGTARGRGSITGEAVIIMLTGGVGKAVSGSSKVAKTGQTMGKIDNLLMPGGKPLGTPGSNLAIRELSGGVDEAQRMFNQLTVGGEVIQGSTYPGTLVRLPNGGTVGLRTTMTRSPNSAATIDINIPGISIDKIKFNP